MEYTGINKILKSEAVQKYLDKLVDGTFTEFLDDWKWIFSFSKKYKWIVVFYTILGIFGSSLSLFSSWLSAQMINIITGGQKEKLWILIVVAVGSLLFSLVFSSIMSRVSLKISIYVNNDIQSEIFDKIIDAKWEEIHKYKNGDILNRFNSDVSTISSNAIAWIPNLIINIYTFIATFIVLFRMDPIMAVIAIVSAPVLVLMSHYVMRKLKEYRQKIVKMNSEMMAFETETFYNFDSIKSFGVSKSYSKKLRWWQKKYKDYNLDYNKFQIKTNIALSILSSIVTFTAFGYCLFRLWKGVIPYGDMTFFLGQRSALTAKFKTLVGTIPGMLNSSISAHRIRELVDLPKEEHDIEVYQKIKAVADDGIGVKVKNVSYSYSDGKNVYKDASFEVNPGEMVAVLGDSGAGKTTMFRLLLGLVEPNEGDVMLVDKDNNEIKINADLRKLVSYVPQGNSFIMGTIKDNMLLVKPKATDEEIINALKIACAWDFVAPVGIDAHVGERGRGLSEGQAQRIAIARAILRDAPILMLDEATSALDKPTEKQIIDNICEYAENKAIIVSTHRVEILERCKRIYRITDNVIIKEKDNSDDNAI